MTNRTGWRVWSCPPCPHGKKLRRDCATCVDEERARKEHLNTEGRRIADACGGRLFDGIPR